MTSIPVHKTCREIIMSPPALMRFVMEVNKMRQLNWIYNTDVLQLQLLQQQSRVQWVERSRASALNLGFLPRGSWEKSNLPINLIWPGLRTSRYTRARSKMEEIACDSGTDFPKRLQKGRDR